MKKLLSHPVHFLSDELAVCHKTVDCILLGRSLERLKTEYQGKAIRGDANMNKTSLPVGRSMGRTGSGEKIILIKVMEF